MKVIKINQFSLWEIFCLIDQCSDLFLSVFTQLFVFLRATLLFLWNNKQPDSDARRFN